MSSRPGNTTATVEEAHNKRPKDSAFRQQRLPAWQPIFSPKWVIPTFAIVGIVFIPIGVAVLVSSNNIQEVKIQYDGCASASTTTALSQCTLSFAVDSTMKSPVYLYYQLDNFYQNHRRYVSSRDDLQLQGGYRTFADVSNCAPLRSRGDLEGNPSTSTSEVFAPCGLIAWSLFNDSFQIGTSGNPTSVCDTSVVNGQCQKNGIAFPSDVDVKFAPADSVYLAVGGQNYSSGQYPHLIPSQTDQELMVWMRTAALPSFRKLFRIINSDIPPGTYNLIVTDRYPVGAFSGSKYMVLSTAGWIGGKNPFLGIAYIIVGSLCLFFAIVFGIKELVHPRKPEEIRRRLEGEMASISASIGAMQ